MTMQLFQHFGYKGLETASQSRLWKLAAVWDPQPREDALNLKGGHLLPRALVTSHRLLEKTCNHN